jgi:excinuclease ABC subunit A
VIVLINSLLIKGAREHNLKNIDIEIPHHKLVVITGLSGSGKSSLAFDTIFAEGQRRYLESLSSYARQFLEKMEKPDVDLIEGLSPAIAINQKASSHNPRSTVGTVTEIYDYMRVLFSRCGKVFCPQCGKPIARQTIQQIVDEILSYPDGTRIVILAPLVRGRKGEYKKLLNDMLKNGFARSLVDGELIELEDWDSLNLDRNKKHNIDLVVDRLTTSSEEQRRLADSIEIALRYGKGLVKIGLVADGMQMEERIFSEHFSCPDCGISFPEVTPRMFSFNNPYGACPDCSGLGILNFIDPGLVIPDWSKSLDQGAIIPWNRYDENHYSMNKIKRFLRDKGIAFKVPFQNLSENDRQLILYGDEDGDGIISYLEKRMKAAESWWEMDEVARFMATRTCPSCQGNRLRPESLSVKIQNQSIGDLSRYTIGDLENFFITLKLSKQDELIAATLLREIQARLHFLVEVGLSYLTLSRSAMTLSGGESQRIRLATQIGSGLVGVLYVLDEPTIGLHPRDNQKLIQTLKRLRDLGNTVIVVEHDAETMKNSDYLIDMGPGAGEKGGEVIAIGTPVEIMCNQKSLTGQYLSGKKEIPIPLERKNPQEWLVIRGARANNLKNIDVKIPLGVMVGLTGVSGSGKSTLMEDVLYRSLSRIFYHSLAEPGDHDTIEGIESIDKVIVIDQSPIGRTPRSNPATYTGIFTEIRNLFAQLPESKARGYRPGRFSFNVKGGRCEACQGNGVIKFEMHFLPDVFVTCEYCKGKRYARETLDVTFKGKNIAEILDMSVDEAAVFFENIPVVRRKLAVLQRVGLGYIKLGQSATTLSGGEAQRIKLTKELSKIATGRTLYLLDEPTTGLHFADVEKLLDVLLELRRRGNSILIIEHNMDVIKCCDYLVDLGPEGGDQGGQLVAEGTPEEVASNPASYTGFYLREVLKIERKEFCQV